MKKFILSLVFISLFYSIKSLGLINAKPLENSTDVVRLVFKNGWVCTGIYIDSETILTAAHCIHPIVQGEKISLEKIQSENDEVIDVHHVENFSHPDYKEETWHSHDLGIIKTTQNKKFKGEFKIELKSKKLLGRAILYGCGKSDLVNNSRLRLFGENYYFRVGSILFFIGKSKIDNSNLGEFVSIAPNDSGGPIVDKNTGTIIGISVTTTLKDSLSYGLPTLSTATSTVELSNLNFILSHMDKTINGN